MNYSAQVLHYFEQTQHAGSLAAGPNIGVGEAASSSTPDVIKFFIQLEDEHVKIMRFQANGSVLTIACAEFLAEWCEQKSLKELGELKVEVICDALDLPAIKIHTALLAIQALRNALGEKNEINN
ncbi:MAG TPA: iron-sulfur cluster assembly scaffold protein [Coxiellaceae bacterium]|nr:iron-sulfur cluster assembly scaffold protein [Coxiellaceae bacterium]